MVNDTESGAGAPRPAGTASSFAPGDLLAGRYRIVRFLAQGGMGEVYEAEDLELDVRVALKTVRREIADRPGMIDLFVKLGNASMALRGELGLAMVRVVRGELDGAEADLGKLAARYQESARPYATFPLLYLASVRHARDDLAGARRVVEEARDLVRETSQVKLAPQVALAFGRLALTEGQFAEAARLAREAETMFEAQRSPEGAAHASAIAAQALARVDRGAAAEALARARRVGDDSQVVHTRLVMSVAIGKVAAAGVGDAAAAAEVVTRALRSAERAGFVELALDARLALGRLDARAGRGRARLGEVAREAERRGYLLIARQARTR